ncbi:MAG: hypothetical protein DWI27_06295 [Planctomycetota bacterium]|nr:MAG: hypothetical protein DWI27_06295 [Planctomycetota bacterium]
MGGVHPRRPRRHPHLRARPSRSRARPWATLATSRPVAIHTIFPLTAFRPFPPLPATTAFGTVRPLSAPRFTPPLLLAVVGQQRNDSHPRPDSPLENGRLDLARAGHAADSQAQHTRREHG